MHRLKGGRGDEGGRVARRRTLVTLTAVVGVLVLVVVAVGVWRFLDHPGEYERAVGYLPEATLRATYTDWDHVRDAARGDGLGAGSTEHQVAAFLDRAFDHDLTSTSAVEGSTYPLMKLFGFSPLDAQWEVLGQSREGQVVVLSLGADVDYDGIERNLRELGYEAPTDGAGTGGTWVGSSDLVAGIDPGLTPVQENFAVLPDEGLVVMSDNPGPVSATVQIVRSGEGGLDTPLADSAGEPVSAVLWASDFACEDLSMASADAEDQRVADALVQRAGGVSPLSGLVIARQADASITVGMRFENDDQASDNLQPRVDLAAGEAPGQGGTFAERFSITSGEASGEDVVLRLDPKPGQDLLFGDITSGPLLFAAC